jgi:hypothetical protein
MRSTCRALLLLAFGLAGIAGCSESRTVSSDVSRIVDETVRLTPANIPVTIGPLSGELSNLKVVRRVNESTREVVSPPQLNGMLVLKNTSESEAVRLIGGELTYVGSDGAPVKFAEARDAAFTFPTYAVDRLDPGRQMHHSLDVSFPAAAFAGGLDELRLRLTYIPMPYRVDTETVDVSMAKDN